MQKDSFEILFEKVQSRFELVLNGNESLLRDIREARRDFNKRHDQSASLIENLSQKIDGIVADLSAHRSDTEAQPKYHMWKDR